MDLSETFYAAAAGTFPLLVVAVVVAIRFNVGETRKQRTRHQETMDAIATFLKNSPQMAQSMTDQVAAAARTGDRSALDAAVLQSTNHAKVEQFARMVQGENMPRSEKKITRRYGTQRAGAWVMAVLFGIGEASAFMSLALGTKKTAVRDLFGPVAFYTLFPLILVSAVSLVIQAVYAEHD